MVSGLALISVTGRDDCTSEVVVDAGGMVAGDEGGDGLLTWRELVDGTTGLEDVYAFVFTLRLGEFLGATVG